MNQWEWQLLEDKKPVENLCVAGVELRAGDRIRLHPRAGGDAMDIALADKTAVVESIEQDYEGKFHVCVVVDVDPGRDIGLMRQPLDHFHLDGRSFARGIVRAGSWSTARCGGYTGTTMCAASGAQHCTSRAKRIDFTRAA